VGEVIRRKKGSRFIGYYLRFYDHGHRRQLASHQTSYADAKRMLQEIEARIARGEAGLPDRNRQENPTVEDLTERFLTHYSRPKIKDLTRYRIQAKSVLRHALPVLGTQRVQQVTAHDISALRDRLQRTISAGTIKNVLSTLSTMFSWAVHRGLALHNPCRGVERPSTTSSLDFLSAQEVETLLTGAQKHSDTPHGKLLFVAISLAVHTGVRKGELLGLRLQDIDLKTRRLTIARSYSGTTKSGKTRHLRIPTAICPILSDWLDFTSQRTDALSLQRTSATGSQLLFPIGHTRSKVATSDAMLGLPKLMKDLGMRKVSQPWHLLRHTYASHYIMSGGNLLALSQILGHSDIKITMIYSHLDPDFLDAELDRVLFRSKA
jgi:site-specific recombinase XerD